MHISFVFSISFLSKNGTFVIKEVSSISSDYVAKTEPLSFYTQLRYNRFLPCEDSILKAPMWANVNGNRIPFSNLPNNAFEVGPTSTQYLIEVSTYVRTKKEKYVDGIGARSRIFVCPDGNERSRHVDGPCKNKSHKRRERVKTELNDILWTVYN